LQNARSIDRRPLGIESDGMPRDAPSVWSLPEWLRSVRRRVAPARIDPLIEPTEGGEAAFAHADNANRRVLSLLAPMLRRERCLLVTGYQDFLSAMSILVELRPGIAEEKEGAIRLIFGTNTDTTRDFGRGRPLAEEARRHYLGRSGLSLDHEGDLKAVRARDAIASGAITLRVYDRDQAVKQLGRAVPMMHAKAYIGESLAVIGSANFSRAGLRHNLEIVEAIRPSEDSFAARRAWAERTWECGTDWRAEALEILDGLLRLVSPEEAASRMLAEMTGFRPWRVDGNLLHTDTAPRRAPSPSRNSAPASSWCCFPKPP
jgi:hypothetical protein